MRTKELSLKTTDTSNFEQNTKNTKQAFITAHSFGRVPSPALGLPEGPGCRDSLFVCPYFNCRLAVIEVSAITTDYVVGTMGQTKELKQITPSLTLEIY